MTIESEFIRFYNESYGPVKEPISESQKREIRMNFYSGFFIGTMHRNYLKRQQLNAEATEWIEGYIEERTKEEKPNEG